MGFEEPENGIHPSRIEMIAELLKTRSGAGQSQYVVTTHSPLLPDHLPNDSLFPVRRIDRETRVDHFSTWGPLARRNDIDHALDDSRTDLPVSERILRGDFDA